jgi:DNA repair exonuclease SbcCD nuclease subunit
MYSDETFEVFGIPYYPDPDDFKKALDDIKKMITPDSASYLLMHQTVGFTDLVPDDIDPDNIILKEFDYVFNGHIHKHSIVRNNFINVGSPIHRDAGDVGQDKGYLILDTDLNTIERVITEGYPVFRHLEEGEEMPEEWEDDYVIVVPKPILVSQDEVEVQEKFDHNRVSHADLLKNFAELKIEPEAENKEDIISYGLSLLEHDNV